MTGKRGLLSAPFTVDAPGCAAIGCFDEAYAAAEGELVAGLRARGLRGPQVREGLVGALARRLSALDLSCGELDDDPRTRGELAAFVLSDRTRLRLTSNTVMKSCPFENSLVLDLERLSPEMHRQVSV